MTSIPVQAVGARCVSVPAWCRRLRLGEPVLTVRRARAARRFAAANAVLILLAGWLASQGTYDEAFGWMALGVYLTVASTVQLLSVLPTVRRSAASIE